MQPHDEATPPEDPVPAVPARPAEAAGSAPVTGPICACGHGKQAHEHYRRGSDCALCGCVRFRRRSWLPWGSGR
jgi:hypothetical protein